MLLSGKWIASWTKWTPQKHKWHPTLTLLGRSSGLMVLLGCRDLKGVQRRRLRQENELNSSSIPDVWGVLFLCQSRYCEITKGMFEAIFTVFSDSNYLILKKTDVETVFKIFQETEENKKLVYVSIVPYWSPAKLCHYLMLTEMFSSSFQLNRCCFHSCCMNSCLENLLWT